MSSSLRLFPVNPIRHTQLAGMMFLQFVVMGCTIPIMSLYMKDHLHFNGLQIGTVLSASAIASFFAPLLSSVIADRIIPAERLLSLIHLLGAACMFILIKQTGYVPFLIIFVLYTVILSPAGALTNAISFHHLHDRNYYGDIRLWGTIGWIAAAWGFSAISSFKIPMLSSNLQGALQLSAVSSIVLSIYALLLPCGFKQLPKTSYSLVRNQLSLLINPKRFFGSLFADSGFDKTLILISVFACFVLLVDRFYIIGAAPFVKSIGYPENDILSILSIGQIPEIFLLLILSFILKKFGFKITMLAGIGLEIFRFVLFAAGTQEMLLFSGIVVHGITWAFFFVPITIYIDKQCQPNNRAAIQQLYTFVSSNGVIAGNFIAGICMDFSKNTNGTINFTTFWIVPLIISAIVFVLSAIFFKSKFRS
jgi:nucleoside transporter